MWEDKTDYRLEGILGICALVSAMLLGFGSESCQGDKGTNPHSESSETNYFPLHVGNRWVYKSTYRGNWTNDDTTWSMEVSGTEKIEGKEYSVVSLLNFLGRRETRSYRAVRTDSIDALYLYSGQEQLLYDFSASVGTSWRNTRWSGAGDHTLVTLESRSDTVEVPAGRFVDCLRFSFDLGGTMGEWVEWVVPNVGIVRIVWAIGRPRVPLPTAELVSFVRKRQCRSIRRKEGH